MLLRNRLAAACLAASLLATPFAAFGKTQSESLLQQAIDLVSRWLPAPTHEAPATQVVESAFSPDGGAEALVLEIEPGRGCDLRGSFQDLVRLAPGDDGEVGPSGSPSVSTAGRASPPTRVMRSNRC